MADQIQLAELLEQAIESKLADVRVSMPGYIENYDPDKLIADVRPALKKQYTDGDIQDLPVIPSVPVVWQSGTDSALVMPLKRGDPVLLVFSERSLDLWQTRGGVQAPGDPRKFDLTDAIAIPGLKSQVSKSLAEDAETLLLVYKSAKLKFQKDEKIALGAQGVELLDVLSSLLEALIETRTATALGLQPLTEVPTFTTLKADIDKIKGSL